MTREEKLNKAQREHYETKARIREVKKERTEAARPFNAELGALTEKLKRLGNQIYDLRHEAGQVPEVTDHAMIRYLQRYKGLDVDVLKAEVANHKHAVHIQNVVVTVNPDDNV